MHHNEAEPINLITSTLVELCQEAGQDETSIRSSVIQAIQKAFSPDMLLHSDLIDAHVLLYRSAIATLGLDRMDPHLQERWFTIAKRTLDTKLTGVSENLTLLNQSWRDQLMDRLRPFLAAPTNEGGQFMVPWESDALTADDLALIKSFKGGVNDREFCGVLTGLLKFADFQLVMLPNGRTRVKFAFLLLYSRNKKYKLMDFSILPDTR